MDVIIFTNNERGTLVYNELLKKNFNVKALISNNHDFNFSKYIKPECDLHYLDNINENKSINLLSNYDSDIFLVAGFSQIFRRNVFRLPKLGTINLHAGKLPQYRGGSPLNWQLINGESFAGISAILMDEGIDTGNLLAETKFQIEENDDITTLHKKANSLFPELSIESIYKLKMGDLGVPQVDEQACYWHQRKDKDGEIFFHKRSALEVNLLIRALKKPYPGAWSMFFDKKIIFRKSIIPKFKVKGTPGKVIFLDGTGPYIVCKDKAILITEYEVHNDPFFKLNSNIYFS